jgi:hypothetical protein
LGLSFHVCLIHDLCSPRIVVVPREAHVRPSCQRKVGNDGYCKGNLPGLETR